MVSSKIKVYWHREVPIVALLCDHLLVQLLVQLLVVVMLVYMMWYWCLKCTPGLE